MDFNNNDANKQINDINITKKSAYKMNIQSIAN